MKFTFLFFFISFPLMAIELKINGVTYDIEEYKVENNGKRIIINHKNILPSSPCPSNHERIPSGQRIKRVWKKPVPIKRNPFQRLLDDLDGPNSQKQKRRKQRFQ